MPDRSRRIVIVGGGLLGASTALALKKASPKDGISWLLGANRKHVASQDYNKIIRTPYPDPDYVRLAQEALAVWEDDECFHKTGWTQAISKGGIRESRRTEHDQEISVGEYQKMAQSSIPPQICDSETLWFNQNIGYADTARALRLAVEEAKQLGIEVIEADAGHILHEHGCCRGVKVDSKLTYELEADITIVSAGAWTPQLLSRSSVKYPDAFFRVVGVVVGVLHLRDSEIKSLNMDMPISLAEHGEVMISKAHNILKMTIPFTFEVQEMDHVEDHPLAQDTSANIAALCKWFPQFKDREIQSWVCLDLLTPDGRFIIDEVPSAKNLIIASGGSFHSGKFLPNFGSLVQQFIDYDDKDHSTFRNNILEGCKWERKSGAQHVHPAVVPRRP